ncbi:hypothetical protein [Kosakonia radicincitans]|uniref:hypothetical protein n=1 Tax=Kosakonia radicincitans TaxID=283686 RepID=UPI0023682B5E|nr:hypothetical protein [Kosakonia radicincitans]MDD7993753.1 hypothetical protein [Kosakonia radicincitans]
MIFEKHYEELTGDITLNGVIPFANSTPIDISFLGKKFRKILKNESITCNTFMNVAYEKQQYFDGSVLIWKLQDMETSVFLIEEKKLFVKGKHFWVYCVGIIE